MESYENQNRPAELFGSEALTNVSTSMYKKKTKDKRVNESVEEKDSDMLAAISCSLSEVMDHSDIEHKKEDFINLKENLENELQKLKDIVQLLDRESSENLTQKTPSANLEFSQFETALMEKKRQTEMCLEKLMQTENENCFIRERIQMLELKAKDNRQEPCCNCSVF